MRNEYSRPNRPRESCSTTLMRWFIILGLTWAGYKSITKDTTNSSPENSSPRQAITRDIPFKEWLKTPFAKTVEAVKTRGVDTSYIPDRYFTNEAFYAARNNLFLMEFTGEDNDVYMCTGIIIETPDKDNYYLLTTPHDYNGYNGMSKGVALHRPWLSPKPANIIPTGRNWDTNRDIGIFRLKKTDLESKLQEKLTGVKWVDNANLEKRLHSKLLILGFPGSFFREPDSQEYLDKAFVGGTIVSLEQIKRLQNRYVLPAEVAPGWSGGVVVELDGKTKTPQIIGALNQVFDNRDYAYGSDSQVYAFFSLLNIQDLLNGVIPIK